MRSIIRNPLVRLVVAGSAAFFGFVLVSLLIAYLAASPVKSPLRSILPKAEEAHARIIRRVISPALQTDLSFMPSLRVVFAEGHIHGNQGENVKIRVEITQASTGAVARGASLKPCTGEPQDWDVTAVVKGNQPLLEAGPAQACAWATTRKGGNVDQ